MLTILEGDSRQKLKEIPDASVQMCATSPPYFGLRDYGTGTWEGGDPDCDHGVRRWEGAKQTQGAQSGHAAKDDRLDKTLCECGARRIDRQIGLEETPEQYIANLVEIFREVRRTLKDDGTLWLNLGDSYASTGGAHGGRDDNQSGVGAKRTHEAGAGDQDARRAPAGAKPKDLLMIPARVALALAADGWYLRSQIPWIKRQAMPESVEDRPNSSVEYVFLFSKGQSSSKTIKFSALNPETVHFRDHLFSQCPPSSPTARLCVSIATALSNLRQGDNEFGLPPFYSDKWQERPSDTQRDATSSLPAMKRAASYAAWFLNSHTSTKEFLDQIHRSWVDLGETDRRLICRRAANLFSPSVSVHSDTTVAINDAGKVSKIDFRHDEIVETKSTGCDYYYDHVAVRVPAQSGPSDIKKMLEKKERIGGKHLIDDPGELAKANPSTNIGKKRGVGGSTAGGKNEESGLRRYEGFNERWDNGPKCTERLDRNGGSPTRHGDHIPTAMMRNWRNGDAFVDTLRGLLESEDGEPLAFLVNPQPYKEAHFAT